jgi:ABC-type Mn2+/Zn2+ transport system permease subunit
MVALSVALAASSAVVGLYLSFYLNVASGASIVLVETALFVVALVFSPRRGLLATRSRRSAAGA